RARARGGGSARRVLQNALRALCWQQAPETTMARSTHKKQHPLSMRLPEADIAVIDRAARLRGRSRTDFVREAAMRAAEEVLTESVLIRMNPAGFSAFLAALSGPATPVREMVDVLRRPAPWERRGARR